MPYRICKSFQIESGHMLAKHPGLCRFPHGHSRTVEVVIASENLNGQDMVCDFKTVKLALKDFLARFDHAIAMNSDDPSLAAMRSSPVGERVIVFEKIDPTTEVLAERIFRFLEGELCAGRTYTDPEGGRFAFVPGLRVERVRVSETSSTWAEFSAG